MLRVPQVWASLIANPLLIGVLPFLLEPLYNPLLSRPPFSLAYRDIGLTASVIPAAFVLTAM